MRNLLIAAGFLVLCCCAVNAELVQPAPINLPSGGIVVTEINLTDGDVLGLLKQAIPAIADAAKAFVAQMNAGKPATAGGRVDLSALTSLDARGLVEAIDGIKSVRLVIAQYPRSPGARQFMADLDQGVAKLGKFNKVLSDIAFFPGAAAVYAEQENGGYIAFAYSPDTSVVYAARIVGFVDVPKLVAWVGKTAGMFVSIGKVVAAPAPDAAPAAKPETGN